MLKSNAPFCLPIASVNVEARHREARCAKWVNNCACICALAAAAVKEDPGLRERYAGQAVELLRRAIAAGYSDAPRPGPLADEAFDSLRGREEFQQLEKQLEARTPARSPGRK